MPMVGVEVESVRLAYLQNTIARLARVMFGRICYANA